MGYSRGDIIIKSEPFTFILFEKFRTEICEQCWEKMGEGTCTCTQCNLVQYCSKACFEAGAKDHKDECEVLKSESSKISKLPDQLRLVLRLWIKIRNIDNCKSEEGYGLSRGWDDLMDHKEDILERSKEFMSEQYSLLVGAAPSEALPTEDQFVSIYGKVLTNSFSLRTDRFCGLEPFGTGMYLLPSTIDHSCVPNCTVVFRGRELLIVATEDIPDGNITEVAKISYVNSMEDIAARQLQLKACWFFQCDCRLCHDISFDEMKHSVKCPGCHSPCPINIKTWKEPAECRSCRIQVDPERFSRYKYFYNLLENGDGGQGMSYDEMCERAVAEMENIFSDRDILYVKTLHYVHTTCIQKEKLSPGILYGERALPMFEMYFGENTGVVAGLLLRLAICHGEAGNTEKAYSYLYRADSIYRLIPGSDHPFYYKDFKKIYDTYISS